MNIYEILFEEKTPQIAGGYFYVCSVVRDKRNGDVFLQIARGREIAGKTTMHWHTSRIGIDSSYWKVLFKPAEAGGIIPLLCKKGTPYLKTKQ